MTIPLSQTVAEEVTFSHKSCNNIVFNTLKEHMFRIFVRIASLGNSNKYPKHMFSEEIRTKQYPSYISFCPLRILYNSKFIIMATSLGTNAGVVRRVHYTWRQVRPAKIHLIRIFTLGAFWIANDAKFLHLKDEYSDPTAQADLSHRWVHMSEFWNHTVVWNSNILLDERWVWLYWQSLEISPVWTLGIYMVPDKILSSTEKYW